MKKNDGFFEHGEKTEEDLLDFKFDDLSYDDTTETSGPNDIIELVDVVEGGDSLDDLELDDISIAFDEDELTEKKPAERDLDRSLGEADLDFDLNDADLESLAEIESEEDIGLEDLAEGAEGVIRPAVSDIETQPDVGLGEKVSIGISEERIEAIIREVIEDVVDRVARETMTNVAERVIGEAIEALKKSIETH